MVTLYFSSCHFIKVNRILFLKLQVQCRWKFWINVESFIKNYKLFLRNCSFCSHVTSWVWTVTISSVQLSWVDFFLSALFYKVPHLLFSEMILFAWFCVTFTFEYANTWQCGFYRGENKDCGWVFKPVPGNPNRCIFCWIFNSDLKVHIILSLNMKWGTNS